MILGSVVVESGPTDTVGGYIREVVTRTGEEFQTGDVSTVPLEMFLTLRTNLEKSLKGRVLLILRLRRGPGPEVKDTWKTRLQDGERDRR